MRWLFLLTLMPFIVGMGAVTLSPPVGQLSTIQLPDGFQISLFADQLEGARSLTLGSQNTLFVGTRHAGVVYALRDSDGDGVADHRWTIATGLNMPNGVAFREGALYVAEIHRVIRFDDIEARLDNPPAPQVVRDDLPTDKHHGWKFIRFGPDGLLYFPVGAPCNICEPNPEQYAAIFRMKPDGSALELFARGVRNTVGFDWHPLTRELWFTDNGRDWLGDALPPDELNRAPKAALDFGYPYCYGAALPDPKFGDTARCNATTKPALALPAHVAPLGMRFYTGKMFPSQYRNRIFIAEHGSWNRTVPVGYRITVATLKGNKVVDYQPFATGWLKKGKAWGRPVDLVELDDGSLLISDDEAGAIYRISWND